jgi:hypothetical protein
MPPPGSNPGSGMTHLDLHARLLLSKLTLFLALKFPCLICLQLNLIADESLMPTRHVRIDETTDPDRKSQFKALTPCLHQADPRG